ncbi:hypothetical protein [Sarcina ventriculi]
MNEIKSGENNLLKATWFTVFMLIFFFPIGLFLMFKYKKFNKVSRGVITGVCAFIVLVPIFNSSNTKSNSSINSNTATPEMTTDLNKDTIQTEKTTKELIEDAIPTTIKNLEKINYVEMIDDSQPVVFILKMNDNLSKNFMLKGAYLNAKDIIKSVYAVAGDKITSYQFVFNFPLVDMYGNEEDGKVLSFDMSKETVEKINWDNITTDNLIALSQNVFIHPDLKQ